MVTIVNFKQHKNNDGNQFFTLTLRGGIEMVKSSTTGRYYATVRETSVTTTFDEATCKSLLGTQMAGLIRKTPCEPYEYTIEDTGEVITLDYNYQYVPEEEPRTVGHGVVEKQLVA